MGTINRLCSSFTTAVHFAATGFAVLSEQATQSILQAERFVVYRTAHVIERELGYPADWAPMTDSNTQLFEVDLSEPTVAGLVTSLQEAGATVVKVGLGSIQYSTPVQHASTAHPSTAHQYSTPVQHTSTACHYSMHLSGRPQ